MMKTVLLFCSLIGAWADNVCASDERINTWRIESDVAQQVESTGTALFNELNAVLTCRKISPCRYHQIGEHILVTSEWYCQLHNGQKNLFTGSTMGRGFSCETSIRDAELGIAQEISSKLDLDISRNFMKRSLERMQDTYNLLEGSADLQHRTQIHLNRKQYFHIEEKLETLNHD